MLNIKCTSADCTEAGIVKAGPGIDTTTIEVICGRCWQPCEATDEKVEEQDANPTH